MLEFKVGNYTIQLYESQLDVIKGAEFPIYTFHNMIYKTGEKEKLLRLSQNGKWVVSSMSKKDLERFCFNEVYFS